MSPVTFVKYHRSLRSARRSKPRASFPNKARQLRNYDRRKELLQTEVPRRRTHDSDISLHVINFLNNVHSTFQSRHYTNEEPFLLKILIETQIQSTCTRSYRAARNLELSFRQLCFRAASTGGQATILVTAASREDREQLYQPR